MTSFSNFLALIFGILSTLLLILRVVGAATYGDRERFLDGIRGITRTFPLVVPFITAVVCWTWYFTKPLGA